MIETGRKKEKVILVAAALDDLERQSSRWMSLANW